MKPLKNEELEKLARDAAKAYINKYYTEMKNIEDSETLKKMTVWQIKHFVREYFIYQEVNNMTIIKTASGDIINVEQVMNDRSDHEGHKMVVAHYKEVNGKMLKVLSQIQQMCTGEFATRLETQCITDAICAATGLTKGDLLKVASDKYDYDVHN